jgi:hypothetical protein
LDERLGFKKPASTGRISIRGFADFKDNHGFKPKSMQFFGNGVRFGFVPCDDNIVYWFFTSTPSNQGEPFTRAFFFLLKNESQSINAKTNNAESYLEIVF